MPQKTEQAARLNKKIYRCNKTYTKQKTFNSDVFKISF